LNNEKTKENCGTLKICRTPVTEGVWGSVLPHRKLFFFVVGVSSGKGKHPCPGSKSDFTGFRQKARRTGESCTAHFTDQTGFGQMTFL